MNYNKDTQKRIKRTIKGEVRFLVFPKQYRSVQAYVDHCYSCANQAFLADYNEVVEAYLVDILKTKALNLKPTMPICTGLHNLVEERYNAK